MRYRYETQQRDFGDLASGAVLYSAPGFPAFPVRLASEIFQRALEHVELPGPVTVWDPCCGSGYLLTVVGMLHRARIQAVLGSDVDPAAVQLAGRNLSLLTETGLRRRAEELDERAARFQKPGYAEAARAAERLAGDRGVESRTGQADVFDAPALRRFLAGTRPQLVLTDVPYGEQTHWSGPAPGTVAMLRTLAPLLDDAAVIAVATRGRKVALGEDVPALERLRAGTRAVALVRARDLPLSRRS